MTFFLEAGLMAKKALSKAKQAVEESEFEQTFFSADALLQLIDLSKVYSSRGIVKSTSVTKYSKRADKILSTLPNSHKKVRALIDLAEVRDNPVNTLTLAHEVAQNIGDSKASSLALGKLGKYYMNKENYETALKLTYQAQEITEKTGAVDLSYRWEWQVGSIYKALGQNEDAILAYQQAISSLQLIRSDLARSGEDLQIDFRLEVEPVYRQLLELLLIEGHSDSEIIHALEVKSLLQLSELENFFGDDCIITKSKELGSSETAKERTTVVNTIILKDNTFIILQLPDGGVKSFVQPISAVKMTQAVEQFRYDLENQENESYLASSNKLYKLLFQPIELELQKTETEQLIFVNDGVLRNVPMAALHDGENFLIEKYSVSNSLGFDVRTNESENIEATTLAFGLTEELRNSTPLPFVRNELSRLNTITGSKNFLDQEFSVENISKQAEKSKYNIIHLATHAEFGGTIQQSYLQAYDEKISLRQLEKILNQRDADSRINLLTLSACSTAVGNKRSVLGLAGIAIRSGVDNVLGSLWSVPDEEMASFSSKFYTYWVEDKLTKSQALRQAQMDLIKESYVHPAVWASLILINS